MVKRCQYGGRWFTSDARVGKRQKACCRDACRKARRQHSQSAWSEKNPEYFRGRYSYVKQWRKARGQPPRPMIQDKISPKKPVTRMIFLIPVKIEDVVRLRGLQWGARVARNGSLLTAAHIDFLSSLPFLGIRRVCRKRIRTASGAPTLAPHSSWA
jgi:hypothetical protein